MDDDRLIEEASAIADRRPVASTSRSDGIRLLDRLSRLFGSGGSAEPASSPDILFLWGALEVRRPLGAGTFGEVFEAWDPTLQRVVALKLRSPETGALRWLDEARNLARVRHTNVLTVHGADVLDGRAGIWTERVVGRTLEEELEATGPFSEAEALRIGRDIASALAAVHAAGLIHGDVKTSNIMLEDGDAPRRAVLVDFGSADRPPDDDSVPAYVMGTPLTMAPEVLDGQRATAGSDVYGLGATLFRALTGRYPIEAASIEDLRRAHRASERPRMRESAPHVSARLARTIERALEPDPAQRWPSAKTFGRALDDIADPTRRIRTRAAMIGGGAVAITALGLLAFQLLRPGGGPITRGNLARPSHPRALVEASRFPGPAEGSVTGYVAAIVDLDRDGFGDLVGIDCAWKGVDGAIQGRVVLFRGSANGPASTMDGTIDGDERDAVLGFQAANAGDVDGDGFDELLVSQEAFGAGQMLARVCLYAGARGQLVPERVWTFTGASYVAGVGKCMSSAGDVNGDGYGDVLISELNAPDLQREEGRVLLFTGSPAGLSTEPVWRVRAGQETAWSDTFLRPIGDLNRDGFDDVVIAANSWDGEGKDDCGQIRIYLGSAAGLPDEPVLVMEGTGTNSHLGTMVCGAGDVNGDGYDDVLISEPYYSDDGRPERGRVLLLAGGAAGPSATPLWQGLGTIAFAHFGFSMDRLGDVDGDGFDDFALGSPQYSDGKRVHLGMVEVYRGGRDGCDARPMWRFLGDRDDGHLGRHVVSGDLSGDGRLDLVVGAPLWADGVQRQGLLLSFLNPAPK